METWNIYVSFRVITHDERGKGIETVTYPINLPYPLYHGGITNSELNTLLPGGDLRHLLAFKTAALAFHNHQAAVSVPAALFWAFAASSPASFLRARRIFFISSV